MNQLTDPMLRTGGWHRRGTKIVLDDPFATGPPEAEHPDVRPSSAPSTFSAPAGVPQEVAGRILTALGRGLWDTAVHTVIRTGITNPSRLTDMIFYYSHPELRGMRIRSDQRDLAREWIEIRDRWIIPALGGPAEPGPEPPAGSGTPASATAAQFTKNVSEHRRFAALVPLLDRYRGDIPLDFLLGWIAVESDGRIDEITPKINERGFFQIHPDESRDHRFQHERLTTDPDYSVRAGIQLVRSYIDLARKRYPWIPFGSELFWRIVKLQHAMGSGLTLQVLSDMRRRGVPPTSWAAIKAYELTDAAKRLHVLLRVKKSGRFGHNVDEVFTRGRQLAASLGR